MNFKMIGRILSAVTIIEAIFMLPAILFDLIDHETKSALAFAYTIAGMLLVAGLVAFLCRKAKVNFYASEGFACVGLSWIVISLFGCIPLLLSGTLSNFFDAFFEIVSGFTTTGATVIADVESCSRGILFWRSVSNWIGGMGMLVFMLAIVPGSMGRSGFTMHLLRAESPGPSVGKLAPRMRKTAITLYGIYIGLTVLNVLSLEIASMSFFESLCAAMSTAGTGGFGVLNDSFTSYSSAIQIITTVFMMLFGVNFSIYYLILLRRFSNIFQDLELRIYLLVYTFATVFITINLRLNHLFETIGDSLRHAAFQTASIMTTTGFATTDFDGWPAFSKMVLLLLMVCGACAGSTGGGIKFARIILFVKTLIRNIRQTLHPNKVQQVRINKVPVSEEVINNTNAYLVAYVIICVFSFLVVSLDGYSIETTISGVLACLNNIGPGLGLVGPTHTYALFGNLSKSVLSIDMLLGRLEIFPILVLISRSTWSRKA